MQAPDGAFQRYLYHPVLAQAMMYQQFRAQQNGWNPRNIVEEIADSERYCSYEGFFEPRGANPFEWVRNFLVCKSCAYAYGLHASVVVLIA